MSAGTTCARRKHSAALARQTVGLMMLMRIERWDVRRDGPLNDAALRQKVKALGYEAAPALTQVDAVSTGHGEGNERVEAVISGLVKVTIDGESAILTAGDIVFVPRGAVCRTQAVGNSPASSLQAVYRTQPV
jgi:mannose-6-phosphate isomerase-like protein (cupin superfamily)